MASSIAALGGGIYNLGTFLFDAATLIVGNHASSSNDDDFGDADFLSEKRINHFFFWEL